MQHGPVRVATARRGPELDGRDDARRPNADRLGEGHARLLIKTGPSDLAPRVSTEIANKGTDSPNKGSDTRRKSPSRMCRFNSGSGVRTRLAVPEDASGLQSQLPNDATLSLIHVARCLPVFETVLRRSASMPLLPASRGWNKIPVAGGASCRLFSVCGKTLRIGSEWYKFNRASGCLSRQASQGRLPVSR